MSDQDTQQPAGDESSPKTDRPQSERGGRERGRGRRRHNAPNRPLEQSLNMDELRELVELINEYGFTDFELENKDVRVRLRRELAPQIIASSASAQQPQSPATGTHTHTDLSTAQPSSGASGTSNRAVTPVATSTEAQPEKPAGEDEDLHMITSPIVGTFYRAPSPQAEAFVGLGSQVSPDTVVCIIEAMKLMNEILAETTGVVAKIYVENGQPVEYGQPLFGIRK
jgi:acetyl-CoA carboxylase biotin carboxyl carrier protein